MRIPAMALLLGAGMAAAGCTSNTRYGLALDETVFTANPPTFAWEKFPAVPETEIADVTYELCVLREKDGAVVFSRKGLTETRHTLEKPLETSAVYRWSVRPWFLFRGERRVGPWAQRLPKEIVPGQTVVPVPMEYFARIVTPD